MRLMIRLNDFSLPSILRDLQEILFYQFWDKEGDKEDLKTINEVIFVPPKLFIRI